MLTDKDTASGAYKIPHIIYADAYFSEMVAYADLVLPDTTYLERWDCISLLDRPICDADGAGDAIRQPVVRPDRDVRPFQDVLIDLGARLGLPGLTNEDGWPRYPGVYPDYIVNHERVPGVGMLAGWRGKDGEKQCVGERNPRQLERYVANGCFWRYELPDEHKFYRARQQGLSRLGGMPWASSTRPTQVIFQLYSEPLQKFRLAARGHGAPAAARPSARAHRRAFRSAADLVPAVRGGRHRQQQLPAARDDAAADGDVPLLGLAERLAAADPRPQPALHEPADGRAAGLATTTGYG